MPGAIGLLHPGEMGAVVGGVLRAAGHEVLWASEGRSEATRTRAEEAGLDDAGTVGELAARCDVLLSICPPHAALDVARSVEGFGGLYVDANAVSPDTTRRIGQIVVGRGAQFVDGGIVGPPPTARGTSRLYLCGAAASEVAALFAGSALEPVLVDGDVGAASALKMVYAAWTKGSAAMLLAIDAVAGHEGVGGVLRAEWEQSQPELPRRLERARQSAASKGWRWVAEMEEIAATFGAAGQPGGFHLAAASVYRQEAPASAEPAMVEIAELEPSDIDGAARLLDDELGGRRQVVLGKVHDVLALPGFVARVADELVGVATYDRRGARTELAALAVRATHRRRGIGGALVEACAAQASEAGASELWLVTTNDNLDALALYQRRGFRLAELVAGGVDRARQQKPEIPPVGDHGIPIRDELVLVRSLAR
jgi:ribosomal protein S18 acetylase RimI-like enzyme